MSRDTTVLNASEISAATIESVAENASDSLVAPLLYYAIGGLPGALLYRLINTADAMLGYRDPEREWLGKIPARLDDLVNLIPARLTAGCILVVAFPYRYGAKETCMEPKRLVWSQRDLAHLAARRQGDREPECRTPHGCNGGRPRCGTRQNRTLSLGGWLKTAGATTATPHVHLQSQQPNRHLSTRRKHRQLGNAVSGHVIYH